MDAEAFDWPGCVARARAGDERAAEELVRRSFPLVAKIVAAYVPRDAADDDLRQEVYLRMFAHLDQYRAAAPFEHWLSRVAVSTCLDGLRRRRRRPELSWSDLSEDHARLVRDCLAGREAGPHRSVAAKELVDQLLSALDAEDQVLLKMLDIEGYTTAEAARLLGRTRTGVKVRASRARARLRTLLAELLPPDSDERPDDGRP
jgi:RNA polymerase sigma-70 factor (ECF subfamily)